MVVHKQKAKVSRGSKHTQGKQSRDKQLRKKRKIMSSEDTMNEGMYDVLSARENGMWDFLQVNIHEIADLLSGTQQWKEMTEQL